MKNIEFYHVKLNNGYWKLKQDLNADVSMQSVWKRFCDTGRIGAFECNWKPGMDNEPHFYWDSDVAKWIEGASYILKVSDNKILEDRIDNIVSLIEKNQWKDGYFNIYYTVTDNKRFTERNNHELYCAGHLIEAAIAYYEATGKDKFLNCMIKYADLIYKVFMVDKSAAFVTPGHEEIEMALVRLYKCIGDKKYLELAGFFIKKRANNDKDWYCAPNAKAYYCQDHITPEKMDSAEGHAVRALYLYCGMIDYAVEAGDKELIDACNRLYDDITERKMYITGGVGSTFMGEAFTVPYHLPNESAYSETCASIALIMFTKRMQELGNSSKYADVIERAMYNGMMDGISLDGRCFFYENPLEINLKNHSINRSTTMEEHIPITERVEVFDCSCCPPNINRTLAAIQGLAYAYEDNTIVINQFMDSTLNIDNKCVSVKTKYPIDGKINITKENAEKIKVRIPSWCKNIACDCEYTVRNGYMEITADNVNIEFEMKPLFVKANPNIRSNRGCTAVQYGPIVYCIEGVDNGDIYALSLDTKKDITVEYSDEYGLNIINAKGRRQLPCADLYMSAENVQYEETDIKLIPYSCHANRGESDMLVWINEV